MQAKRQPEAPKLTKNTAAKTRRTSRSSAKGEALLAKGRAREERARVSLGTVCDWRLLRYCLRGERVEGVPAATGKWLDSPRRTQHAYAPSARPVPRSAFGMGVMRIRNSCGYSNNARLVNFKAAPFTVLLFQVFSLSLALCFFVSTAAHAACVARLRFPCAFSPFSFYCFPLVIVSSKLYGFVAGCAGSIL